MKKKYYNEAIIGNDKIVASFSSKGEMLRLFYPTRDCRQFVDTMLAGIKVNDSAIIYLHDDINNQYEQYYTDDTNIINTKIKNTYFNLSVLQTDFVSLTQNVMIKKLVFTNENTIDLNINFLIYSKYSFSFSPFKIEQIYKTGFVEGRGRNGIRIARLQASCDFDEIQLDTISGSKPISKMMDTDRTVSIKRLRKDTAKQVPAADAALQLDIPESVFRVVFMTAPPCKTIVNFLLTIML